MRRASLVMLVGTLIVAMSTSPMAFGETLEISALQDTRIGNNFSGPQGTFNHLGVMNDPSQPNYQRTLLSFDLGEIPQGQQILDAQLILYRHDGPDGDNPDHRDMQVFRLSKDWVEAEATWADAAVGSAWSNPGADGDYLGTTGAAGVDPYATANDNPAKTDPVSWDITTLVSEWYAGTHDNYGMLILSDPVNKLHFFSRESGGENYGPKIEVSYAIPEPGATCLLLIGAIGVGVIVRYHRHGK